MMPERPVLSSLSTIVTKALSHCERICVCVEGDLRADQAE